MVSFLVFIIALNKFFTSHILKSETIISFTNLHFSLHSFTKFKSLSRNSILVININGLQMAGTVTSKQGGWRD